MSADHEDALRKALAELDAAIALYLTTPRVDIPTGDIVNRLKNARNAAALALGEAPEPETRCTGIRKGLRCDYQAGHVCDCHFGGFPNARPAEQAPEPVDIVTAQHDETGRMWTGPRSDLPRRYCIVKSQPEGEAPEPVAQEPRGCPTPGACSCVGMDAARAKAIEECARVCETLPATEPAMFARGEWNTVQLAKRLCAAAIRALATPSPLTEKGKGS